MGFKEICNHIAFIDIFHISEKRTNGYYKELSIWHRHTLDFLNSPFNSTQGIDGAKEIIFNFKDKSVEYRAKTMSMILDNPKDMQLFYQSACMYLKEKQITNGINCASYAAFTATFSKWMNPDNQTILMAGTAKICESPNKKLIGKLYDHFWVEINGILFDSSGYGDYSYNNHNPIVKTEDILSGKFEFKPIIKNPKR